MAVTPSGASGDGPPTGGRWPAFGDWVEEVVGVVRRSGWKLVAACLWCWLPFSAGAAMLVWWAARADGGGDERVPVLFLTSLGAVAAGYVLVLAWSTGATLRVAREPGLALGTALAGAVRDVPRLVGVFAVLGGTVMVMVIAVTVAVLSTWTWWALALVPLGGAGWLWMYARWCLAAPAAVYTRRRPLRASARATHAHRVGVLVRVVLVSLTVGAVASLVTPVLVLVGLTGVPLVTLVAVLVRVSLSMSTAAVSAAANSVLYRALTEPVT